MLTVNSVEDTWHVPGNRINYSSFVGACIIMFGKKQVSKKIIGKKYKSVFVFV